MRPHVGADIIESHLVGQDDSVKGRAKLLLKLKLLVYATLSYYMGVASGKNT